MIIVIIIIMMMNEVEYFSQNREKGTLSILGILVNTKKKKGKINLSKRKRFKSQSSARKNE